MADDTNTMHDASGPTAALLMHPLHLGCTRSHDALDGAASMLLTLANEMDRVGEEGAADRVILWENGIRFIARSLADNAEEVWNCLKSGDREAD